MGNRSRAISSSAITPGPLGMADTGYNPDEKLRDRIAPTEEDTAFRHRKLRGEVHDERGHLLRCECLRQRTEQVVGESGASQRRHHGTTGRFENQIRRGDQLGKCQVRRRRSERRQKFPGAFLRTARHTSNSNGKVPCFYGTQQRTSDGPAPDDPNGLRCHDS